MTVLRAWMVGLSLYVFSAPVLGAGPANKSDRKDAEALAATIDRYFEARWAAAKVQPAPLADDAEFLRRVYLDLAGRIPTVTESRAFLDDGAADKRLRLIDSLLARPSYARHFANFWRSQWLSEVKSSFIGRFLAPGFERWIRSRLDEGAGYDQMVRELLTTPVDRARQALNDLYSNQSSTPVAFIIAKESKAEILAGSTARMFLGVRLECAQCHDHPFATWKREAFWGLAAFFAGIQTQSAGDFSFPTGELNERREIAIPGSERVVQAGFLDGTEPRWKFRTGARETLADWVTAPSNPYFSRAAVNRLWAHLFGMGLTEPVDDMMGQETVAHHQALLDELAKQFTAHRFDLKFLLRAMTASKVYQLSSSRPNASPTEPALFARRQLKGLSPEQLFDSVATATGYYEPPPSNPFEAIYGVGSARADFLAKFAEQTAKSSDAQTSILQALALMNGTVIADATSVERGATLAAVADAPFLTLPERIETLYLAVLSRKPRARELDRAVKYIETRMKVPLPEDKANPRPKAADWADTLERMGKFAGDVRAGKVTFPQRLLTEEERRHHHALADVYWALLNGGEFMLNH
jgi:hypothetical protein